jgi:hypothetical protein
LGIGWLQESGRRILAHDRHQTRLSYDREFYTYLLEGVMKERLKQELDVFKNPKLWEGGYYEGNPLDPKSESSYSSFPRIAFENGVSTLHRTYLKCIKPYINSNINALEIGPGRGAWSNCMLGAKELWCLDANSAEQTKFFQHIKPRPGIHFIQVEDFECRMLPDNHFDFMFSYGCLCHVSLSGITEYAKHLYSKMKSGANCFWMVADQEKYNSAIQYAPNMYPVSLIADGGSVEARWYDATIENTCKMLSTLGYKIICRDMNTNLRDPVIHFKKP